jgi:hypothetical protein
VSEVSEAGATMSENEPTSPRRLYRTTTLKDFPMSVDETHSLSTRGQHLPGLIASRSNTNIAALRRNYNRRRSSLGAEDLPRRSQDGEEQSDAESHDTPQRLHLRVSSTGGGWGGGEEFEDRDRRMSMAASILMTPQMRSQRLIGNPNPRYRWEQYYHTDEELKKMRKPIRKYYERINMLIRNYIYIDKLLDSSLPHHLIQEYQQAASNLPNGRVFQPSDVPTITEEPSPMEVSPEINGQTQQAVSAEQNGNGSVQKIKRTPNNIYRHREIEDAANETTPLIKSTSRGGDEEELLLPPDLEVEDDIGSQSRIVSVAIAVNTAANLILLIMKIVVAALTSSVSVFASLVDAALDFLSTAIVWTSTYLISRSDQYAYPIGRRRLEPVGVLVFSVIMCTAFFQVAIEGFQKLMGPDHSVVQLTIPAIVIMASTVAIKLACWFWCRLIKNSSVQALAQDAMTDVIFNTFSIIFPLIGFYANVSRKPT